MDPSSQRSWGWNFVSCEEVLLVSWCNIIVLGDLSFSWGEEGLSCWEDDARSEQLAVILFSLSWLSIKLFKFSSTFLYDWWFMHLCGQYISSPILFMIVDLCSWIVLCCFDSTGALWSWVDEEASGKDLSEGRGIKQGTKRKTEVGLLCSPYLLFIKENESSFSLFVSKIATNLSGTSSSA